MENKTFKQSIIDALLESEQEIISENLVGLDFLSLYYKRPTLLLTELTEDLLGYGAYLKDWT